MSDKVVDLEKARERLRSPNVPLDLSEEIVWAENEMDSVDEEMEEIGTHLNNLSTYAIELASYLGAITVAKDCGSVPDDWLKVWTEFKERREEIKEEMTEEEKPLQTELSFEEPELEIVFEPDFVLDEE